MRSEGLLNVFFNNFVGQCVGHYRRFCFLRPCGRFSILGGDAKKGVFHLRAHDACATRLGSSSHLAGVYDGKFCLHLSAHFRTVSK